MSFLLDPRSLLFHRCCLLRLVARQDSKRPIRLKISIPIRFYFYARPINVILFLGVRPRYVRFGHRFPLTVAPHSGSKRLFELCSCVLLGDEVRLRCWRPKYVPFYHRFLLGSVVHQDSSLLSEPLLDVQSELKALSMSRDPKFAPYGQLHL